MKHKRFSIEHKDIIHLLPVNCRFWLIIKIEDTYSQRFVKIKDYNTSFHQIQDYYKTILPLKLI